MTDFAKMDNMTEPVGPTVQNGSSNDTDTAPEAQASDRVAILREAADECDTAGAAYTARAQNEHAAAAFTLMETFLRMANEAEYVAAPCGIGGCEPGGEPCDTHERLMAHAEGDHELCEPDCWTTDEPPAPAHPAEITFRIETYDGGLWLPIGYPRSTLAEAREVRNIRRTRVPGARFRIVEWTAAARVIESDEVPASTEAVNA